MEIVEDVDWWDVETCESVWWPRFRIHPQNPYLQSIHWHQITATTNLSDDWACTGADFKKHDGIVREAKIHDKRNSHHPLWTHPLIWKNHERLPIAPPPPTLFTTKFNIWRITIHYSFTFEIVEIRFLIS